MVQQVIATPKEQQELVIEDSTPPEQLAQEAELLAGRSPQAEEPAAPSETPAPPAETPQSPAAEAPPAAPTAPPRTYSEQEFQREREQWQRRTAGAQRQAAEAQRRLTEVNLEAQVEAYQRAEEARLTAQVGADEARNIVRAPDRTKLVRDHFTAQQQLQEAAVERVWQSVEAEEQAKVITARHFAQTHNVAAEDVDMLLSTSTPEAMERLAKRIGQANRQKQEDVAAKRAAVPPETRQTALESGISGTAVPESEDTRINRLNETPSWEWSDDDIRFMRGR